MSSPVPRPGADRRGLAIRVLGPLEAAVDGAPLVVDTRKALAILALLAVERRPYAREELAALLWPESDDESARGALRRTLSVLRSALGGPWLRVDRSVVALDDEGTWVDLGVVEASADASDLTVLAAAAEVARGPFLAGFSLRDSPDFDDWRATRAVAVERSVAALLDRLVVAAEGAGDGTTALAAAVRRVDLDPLDEASHRRLMALLARSGDRTGAIRQYRACVAVLERELGVAPLAETTDLYEDIRDGRSNAAATQPSAAAPPAAAAEDSPSRPARLPLVGRDAELASLLGAHGSASTDGRVALVEGEAGIGKTRLVEAVAEAVAAAGGRTLVARGYASEAGIAYGPIAELLRVGLDRADVASRLRGLPATVLGEVERIVALPGRLETAPARRATVDTAADPAARARLLEALATVLCALVAGPVSGLLAVEDVQWADDATRETLTWLARRLAGRQVLLLVTWRPEDLDERGATFVATLDGLPGGLRLGLGRFDREEVAALVAAGSAAGLPAVGVDGLLAESEGLPLFVVEALMSGGSGDGEGAGIAARSVRALLRERLASVSETATQVLAAAAVIGRSFDVALVRGTSGRSEEEALVALEELVRRGIVRELEAGRGALFDFSHARFRDAAYEGTGLARRRLLHRRAADLLRADPVGRDDVGRLVQVAIHERGAGRDAEAAEAFREAGLRARAMYAHREAAAHLETALALGHPDIVGIDAALGELRTAQGDYAGAVAALEAAAAVSDDRQLPAIELRLGRVHARRGDPAAAASHLDAAIGALDEQPGGDPALLARALVERAVVASRAGDQALAAATASRALAIADATGDPEAASAAHRVLGLVARERGDLAGARRALSLSLSLAATDPDAGAAIAARNALALVEAASGDHAASVGLLEAALEAARRTGERHLEAALENNLADQLQASGRPDEAMIHLKRAVALFAEVGGRPGELEPEIWKLVTW